MTGINDIVMQALDVAEAACEASGQEDFIEMIPQAVQIIMNDDGLTKRIMHYCLRHPALLERGFLPRKLLYIGQDRHGLLFSFRTRHRDPLAIRLLPEEQAAQSTEAVGEDFSITTQTGEVLCVRVEKLSAADRKKRKTHQSRGKTLEDYKTQVAQYRLGRNNPIREKLFSDNPITAPGTEHGSPDPK